MKYTIITIAILSLVAAGSVNGALVGKWAFNENSGSTAIDSSGNGINGTLCNYISYIKSPGTGAITLDGKEDYVSFGTNGLLAITGAYSIEAWIKIRSVNGEAMILGKTPDSYGMTYYTNGNIYFYGGGSGGNNVSYAPTLGQWVHIVGTADPALPSNNVKLYVNGVLTAWSTDNRVPGENSGVALISGADKDKTAFLNADIDELRLYNHALSQTEVTNSYSAGVTKYVMQNCADVLAKGYGLQADLNGDCRVNLKDLSKMAASWLQCNDPTGQGCQ